MPAQILSFSTQKREAEMTQPQPPDPAALRLAKNQLIAALFNYREISTGASDTLVSYLDVPDVQRECWYRLWAVPVAIQAIWRDGDGDGQ